MTFGRHAFALCPLPHPCLLLPCLPLPCIWIGLKRSRLNAHDTPDDMGMGGISAVYLRWRQHGGVLPNQSRRTRARCARLTACAGACTRRCKRGFIHFSRSTSHLLLHSRVLQATFSQITCRGEIWLSLKKHQEKQKPSYQQALWRCALPLRIARLVVARTRRRWRAARDDGCWRHAHAAAARRWRRASSRTLPSLMLFLLAAAVTTA